MKTLLLLMTTGAALSAQPALTAPRFGFVLHANGSLFSISGARGAFQSAPAAQDGIVSAGSSGNWTLLKKESSVVILDGDGAVRDESDAPAGSALFAFAPDGTPALAFYTETNALAFWSEQGWQPAPFTLSGVLSVAARSETTASIAAIEDDALVISEFRLADGAVLSRRVVQGGSGPVLITGAGNVVFPRESALVVLRPDGSEISFPCDMDVAAMTALGADWIDITGRNEIRHLALTTAPGHEGLFELPELRQ